MFAVGQVADTNIQPGARCDHTSLCAAVDGLGIVAEVGRGDAEGVTVNATTADIADVDGVDAGVATVDQATVGQGPAGIELGLRGRQFAADGIVDVGCGYREAGGGMQDTGVVKGTAADGEVDLVVDLDLTATVVEGDGDCTELAFAADITTVVEPVAGTEQGLPLGHDTALPVQAGIAGIAVATVATVATVTAADIGGGIAVGERRAVGIESEIATALQQAARVIEGSGLQVQGLAGDDRAAGVVELLVAGMDAQVAGADAACSRAGLCRAGIAEPGIGQRHVER